MRPKRTRRIFRIIDVDDVRFPFGLVDPSDTIVRIDLKPEWLEDHAFQALGADDVVRDGEPRCQIPDSTEA